jgi:hypothetical protein
MTAEIIKKNYTFLGSITVGVDKKGRNELQMPRGLDGITWHRWKVIDEHDNILHEVKQHVKQTNMPFKLDMNKPFDSYAKLIKEQRKEKQVNVLELKLKFYRVKDLNSLKANKDYFSKKEVEIIAEMFRPKNK